MEVVQTNLTSINKAQQTLASSGIVVLPPDANLLNPEQWSELERLLSKDALKHERVTCGDAGDSHDVEVGRLVIDTPKITVVNEAIATPVLRIAQNSGLLSHCSNVLGFQSLDVCDCRSHIMNRGNFVGRHTDLESNPAIRGFVVLQIGQQYEGGDFLVHHPENPSRLHLEYRSILIGDPKIPHEVSEVENGHRHSFVMFLSEPVLSMPDR